MGAPVAEGPLETAFSTEPDNINLNNTNLQMSPQSTRVNLMKNPDAIS